MKRILFLLCVPALLSAQTFIYQDTLSFVRPANATAYAAGDIVTSLADSAILNFAKVDNFPGHSYIVGARIVLDTASTAGSFRLWIYNNSTDYSKIADNAAYVIPYNAIRTALVGYIDFSLSAQGVGASSGGNAVAEANINIPITGTYTNGLYGVLTATSAYTPKFSGRVWLGLTVQRLLK
jgi:hypothetical protein